MSVPHAWQPFDRTNPAHLTCCVIDAFAVVQIFSWVVSAVTLACAFVRLVLVAANCCAHVGGGAGDPASRRRGA